MTNIIYQVMFKPIFAIITAIVALFSSSAPAPVTPVEPSSPIVSVNPNPIAESVLTQDITVMSYNLKISGDGMMSVENRAPKVIQLIKKHGADSVGVQEADKTWTDLLEAGLTDYARVGTYRDDGIEKGESSSIFYLKDKYELIDSGNFWLSETPDVPSLGWDSYDCFRICTYAVLRNKETGFTYAHFNAHFDNVGTVAKTESVALVTKRISEIAPDIPVVLTGDFNFRESSYNYDYLLDSGLNDTKYLAEKSESGNTYHGHSPIAMTNEPIDYIMVNGYVESVASYEIDDSVIGFIWPSDHYPIISELTIFNGGNN